MDYKVLDLEFSAGINPYTVSKALGVSPTTIAEYYAGYTSGGDLLDITGNGRTLTDSGSPTTSISTLMDQDRNHLQYYALNGSSQLFSAVHSEWMNMFDADFTIVLVVKSPSSAPVAEKMLLCHGETNVSGLYVSMDTSGYYKVYANKAASSVNAVLSTNKADDYWHVIHIVRSSTSLNIYVDATVGTSADPTTFGIDVSETFYLGSYKGPANYWPGGWLYARLQTTAMSTDAISRENAMWKGIAGGRGGCSHQVPTYTRAEASLAERVTGSTAVVTVNPNWPAKTPDGGMLVQGDVAQLCQRTKEFSTSPWSTVSASRTETVRDVPGSRRWSAVASDYDGTNLIASVFDGYVYISSDSGSTWTACTALGVRNWVSVASDDDGSVLIVCSGAPSSGNRGCVYVSTNSGSTWTYCTVGIGYTYFTHVAADRDGSVLVACSSVSLGSVYVSTDSGLNWTQRLPGAAYKSWKWVATDDDGSHLIACEGNSTGYVWTSTDSGATWNNKTSALGLLAINSVTSDNVGTKLAFTSTAGHCYTSTDSGANWVPRTISSTTYRRECTAIASSTSGANLVACCGSSGGGPIYTSTDSGATWVEKSAAGDAAWRCVATDSDGTFLIACAGSLSDVAGDTEYLGHVHYSSDSGTSWAAVTDPVDDHFYGGFVNRCVCNSTGSFLATSDSGNYIHTSSDSGGTWTRQLNSGIRAWSSMAVAGNYLVASVAPGYIYTSSDSGVSWTERTTPGSRTWYWLTIDSTGQYMAACAASAIWVSTDYGASWVEKNSEARVWYRISISGDGQKLVATVNTGYIYTSPSPFTVWTQQGSVLAWNGVASSSDGVKLVAVVSGGQIYTSTNSGAGWTPRDSNRAWYGVASDSTGTNLIACVLYGYVYTSTDSGVSWTANTALGLGGWFNVSMDSDGTFMCAVDGFSFVWISTDSGVTWTQVTALWKQVSPRTRYMSLAVDTDGSNLAVAGAGYIATSADYGVTWTECAASGCRFWRRITSDSTGTKLAAVAGYSYIFVSADSGATWTAKSTATIRNWTCIASDSDGSNLIAAVSGGNIYLSVSPFTTWTAQAAPGNRTWYGVASDSVGTKLAAAPYNYYIWTTADGGTNWTQQNGSGLRYWTCIASSSNGNILLAGVSSGYLYLSINSGVSWTELSGANQPGSQLWLAVSMDTTGTYLAAAAYYRVFYSSDGGTTWTTYENLTETYSGIAISSSGTYMTLCSNNSSPINLVNGDLSTLNSTDYKLTCSSTATPLAPDGTAANFKLVASSDNQEHAVIQQITLTAAYHIFEVDVTTGDKNWVYIKDQTVSNAYAYFNTTTGVVGTTGAGCTASIYTRNNRRRCAICVLGTAATHTFQISPAASNGTLAFAGDGATPNVYVWEASCHLGTFQTLPVTRSSAAVTRSADSLTYPSDFILGYFVGNSYQRNTLAIEVRVKCQYTDTNNIGANTSRPFLCIGGNAGTASATRNHVVIHGYNQYVYASFYSNGSVTERYMRHTVTNANQWHTYKLTLDFTDLSASTFTKDDVPFTPGESANMSGTHDFDATNGLLRVGQQYDGTVTGFCEIDYIKIWVGTA